MGLFSGLFKKKNKGEQNGNGGEVVNQPAQTQESVNQQVQPTQMMSQEQTINVVPTQEYINNQQQMTNNSVNPQVSMMQVTDVDSNNVMNSDGFSNNISDSSIDPSIVLERMQNKFAQELEQEEALNSKNPMDVFSQNIELDEDNPMSVFGADSEEK